mmetsp:Transcript_25560/g.52773  ORF Transcript_25560/g.52773 Transcript_25560/m.52773 type:complete len:209 (+) Transcript_25560:4715-5341(+)
MRRRRLGILLLLFLPGRRGSGGIVQIGIGIGIGIHGRCQIGSETVAQSPRPDTVIVNVLVRIAGLVSAAASNARLVARRRGVFGIVDIVERGGQFVMVRVVAGRKGSHVLGGAGKTFLRFGCSTTRRVPFFAATAATAMDRTLLEGGIQSTGRFGSSRAAVAVEIVSIPIVGQNIIIIVVVVVVVVIVVVVGVGAVVAIVDAILLMRY